MGAIYIFLIAAGFISALLQTAIGFGSAIMMMSILPLFLPQPQAQIICLSTCIVLAASLVARTYKFIRLKVMIPMAIPALACALVFSRLSIGMDTHIAKVLLGFVFIALSLYFSFMASRICFKPSVALAICTGTLSGVMNGLFSMGGPPAVLYMSPSIEDRKAYLATSQSYFLILNVSSLLMRLFSAGLQETRLGMMAACAIGALCGTFAGCRLVSRLNASLLKRLVYIFIGVNGVIIVLTELLT